MDSCEEYTEILSKCKTDDNIATHLIVAVMTICGTLNSPIDLAILSSKHIDGFQMIYQPNKKAKDLSVNHLIANIPKIKNSFYNCLTVLYNYVDSSGNTNKISSKIFPNGSIHFTGCRNIETAHNAPVVLFNLIKEVPESIKEPDNFKLNNLRTVMINSNFNFKKGILQEKLKEKVNELKFDGTENPEKVWRIATFQPEKYPGVNIRFWSEKTREIHKDDYNSLPFKINGQIGIFIFRSGKGTITGAKNIKDIKQAYDAITNLVRNNQNLLF